MEGGEQVQRDRLRKRTEEGKERCRSQGEVGEPHSQRVEEGEEVQGEGRGWGESWKGQRPWGEQEVGGLDSSGLEFHILRHCTWR